MASRRGEGRVVTRSLIYHEAFRLVGPGGTPNIAGTDFLYLERNGDHVELRAVPPEGPSRREERGANPSRVAAGTLDDGSTLLVDGYCVSTVGLGEDHIRMYIREQEKMAAQQADLEWK